MLSEGEQQQILERIERIHTRMTTGSAKEDRSILAQLSGSVALLTSVAVLDLVRAGRTCEMIALLAEILGEEEAARTAERLAAWVRKQRVLDWARYPSGMVGWPFCAGYSHAATICIKKPVTRHRRPDQLHRADDLRHFRSCAIWTRSSSRSSGVSSSSDPTTSILRAISKPLRRMASGKVYRKRMITPTMSKSKPIVFRI
ncbi:MAG: hypothetical protein OXI57_12665 [Rhodospirillales bacterium]|nr:hypothetical protein [Rhodospirillales bacterium]